MAGDESVTFWIDALKQGDEAAAERLWQAYFQQLVQLARRKMGSLPRRVVDEEDVAQSVFRCLCAGAARGRLAEMNDRDDLWRMLVTMTLRKVIDQKRRALVQKRGGGRVRGESVFGGPDGERHVTGIQQLVDRAPPPEVLVQLDEEQQRLFELLDDPALRRVAQWKLEGYTNDEIAAQLRLTTRSIERKLQRIREKWSSEGNG